MHNSLIDVANELLIIPHAGGIKLLKPSALHENTNFYNVSQMFTLPLNVYFVNFHNDIQNINESTLVTCGFPSAKETIGKSVKIAAKKETAEAIIRHDNLVLTTEKLQIQEENFIRRLDELSFAALSFKFPWYGSDDKLIGLFGCSIVMGSAAIAPLAKSMSLLVDRGLLPATTENTKKNMLPGKVLDDIYLSQRESECLKLLVKGKTAKMIAASLKLSPRTVEHYIENIKIKLSVYSRAELIDKAIAYFKPIL